LDAGQHLHQCPHDWDRRPGRGCPIRLRSAIFLSGYKRVNIWFAPLPLSNFGGMASLLRETQLTRTKFTSLLKVELLNFPLMLVASFVFWSYITGLGRFPRMRIPTRKNSGRWRRR